MRKLLTFFLLLFLTVSCFANQYLISAKKVMSYTAEQLDSVFNGLKRAPRAFTPVQNGVDIYEVIYASHWHDFSVVKASGLYFVPTGKNVKAPLVAVHHGTSSTRREEVKFGGHQALSIVFAADGYAALLPDFIGLGKGEKFHLYHHVATEAMATIDFIRAAKELNKEIGVEFTEDLFLTGYSQGGHSTMAVHKVMQEQYPQEFTVTASAPLSGAYDLDGVQGEVMFHPYSHPGYLPYLLLSYAEAYELGLDTLDIFKEDYAPYVHWLFTGEHSMGDLNDHLPTVPKDMIRDTLVKQFQTDPDFPFRVALRENSVDNWKPEAPVLMCYCKRDEQVSYKNALVAKENMDELGAENVRKKKVANKFGHSECAVFAYMYTKMYFDSFLKGSKKGRLGPWGKRILLRMGIMMTKPGWKKRKKQERKARKKK